MQLTVSFVPGGTFIFAYFWCNSKSDAPAASAHNKAASLWLFELKMLQLINYRSFKNLLKKNLLNCTNNYTLI